MKTAVYIGSGVPYDRATEEEKDRISKFDLVLGNVVRPDHYAEMKARNPDQVRLQIINFDVLIPLEFIQWRNPNDLVWDLNYQLSFKAASSHPEWFTGRRSYGGHYWLARFEDQSYVDYLIDAVADHADRWKGFFDGYMLEALYTNPIWMWKGADPSQFSPSDWHNNTCRFAKALRLIGDSRDLLMGCQAGSQYMLDKNWLRTQWDLVKFENPPQRAAGGRWKQWWDSEEWGGPGWYRENLAAPVLSKLSPDDVKQSPLSLSFFEVVRREVFSQEYWETLLRQAMFHANRVGACITWAWEPGHPLAHRIIPDFPELTLTASADAHG
ncbi:MAG: hypothetical protein KJ970_13270 [Candidatus Eisenbacteria bacterium]|uniref:Uncharacterized protein n=1 Tax=Eiseniibacteriota bacterium TaxID=2212470 RepID=A0A948W762_UNCEI|nr:hypothetical protein [Candidatus Eisenbacteria bacterium]MBU1947887.1 hypothetical protein [Candidatus Eisenbacteria bacterium]MBU2691885.1 hypothetical protein [Candidatus Eisenbacteria bacterium]